MNRPANKSTGRIAPRNAAATKLDMLISHYHSIDEQLRREIEADREIDAIQFLDQQLQKILRSLKDYRASDQSEAYKHLMFFLGDFKQQEDSMARKVDAVMVSNLMRHYMLPEKTPNERLQYGDVASLMNKSPNRISLIDMDHRYQFTSRSNAANYGCAPGDICGQHVAEVIGGDRFVGRAKNFFHRCFDGEIVQYAHILDGVGPDDTAYMKCQMQPHYDTSGALTGAVVTMTDITEELMLGVDGIDLEPIIPTIGSPAQG